MSNYSRGLGARSNCYLLQHVHMCAGQGCCSARCTLQVCQECWGLVLLQDTADVQQWDAGWVQLPRTGIAAVGDCSAAVLQSDAANFASP